MKHKDLKIRHIIEANRAIKRVALPLVNRPSRFAPAVSELNAQRATDGAPTDDQVIEVGIRVLTAYESAEVLVQASEFARARKVPDEQLNDRNPIYNLGCSVYTCAIACVDPDSNVADPDPFFGERGDLESAALEVLCSEHIGRDGIQYLTAAQQLWQDRCSTTALKVSPQKMVEIIAGMANENDEEASATFLDLRPGMQWLCMRSMAKQLVDLLALKSSSSWSSTKSESEQAS